jgi:Raf kinase inhibitor-like YbhB/YbcL family protein
MKRDILIITGVIVIVVGFFIYQHNKNIDMNIINSNQKMLGTLKITSSAFSNNSFIPQKYSCDGENINPPFEISGVPQNAISLVLIVDDPDAPNGTWDHWIKFNILPNVTSINENDESFGISGKGSGGKLTYQGPCPPSGRHHYFFKLYALDTKISLSESATKKDVLKTIDGHILDQTSIVGLYKR